MSLSKKLCLRSDSKKRQSFSERICDDLSEVILQYLPLKDKFRYECVSKQFQRTVFQKQFVLDFTSMVGLVREVTDPKRRKIYRPPKRMLTAKRLCLLSGSHVVFDFNLNNLELILKKCPNIETIKISENLSEAKSWSQAMRLIITYCRHLVLINCNFNKLSESSFKQFVDKFGHKLKSYEIESSDDWKYLKSFLNVEVLVTDYTDISFIVESLLNSDVRKLKDLRIVGMASKGEVYPRLHHLFERYKTLQYLRISLFIAEKNDFNYTLEQISRLNQLIHLGITTRFGLNEKLFFSSFKKLTQNCTQLKSIECVIKLSSDQNLGQLLSPLKALKQLKRLTLSLRYEGKKNLKKEMNSLFSFNCFNGMNGLTHLEIIFPYNSTIDERVLTNIDINLPNLQLLRINRQIKTDLNGYQLIAESLSRLSRLQTIDIYVEEESVREIFKTKLIKNCNKIKSFSFGYNSRFNSDYVSDESDDNLYSDSDPD